MSDAASCISPFICFGLLGEGVRNTFELVEFILFNTNTLRVAVEMFEMNIELAVSSDIYLSSDSEALE